MTMPEPQIFTVLLLYPDYLSENYGEETYMTSLEATTVGEAQTLAQEEAYEQYYDGIDEDDDDERSGSPDDFAVLAVILGQHADIKEID